MNIYVYMYEYIHIYVYIHICIYIHIYIHMPIENTFAAPVSLSGEKNVLYGTHSL